MLSYDYFCHLHKNHFLSIDLIKTSHITIFKLLLMIIPFPTTSFTSSIMYVLGRLGWRHWRTGRRPQPPVRLQMLLLVLQLQPKVLLLRHDLPVRVVDGVLLGLWVCAVDLLSRVVLHPVSAPVASWMRPYAEVLGHMSLLLLRTAVWNLCVVFQ